MKFYITGINIKERENDFDSESVLGSIKAAFSDSGKKIDKKNSRNIGIFLGTTFNNAGIRKNNTENYHKGGVRVVNPADFPKCLISYLGGHFSGALGLKGANSTLSSGISSGIDALTQAAYFTKRDKRNRAIIVELNEKFSEDLNCVLSGSTCLIVENTSSARKKHDIYGEVLAIESSFEPEGKSEGLVNSLQKILKKCALNVNNIDCVFSLASPKTEQYNLEKKALQSFFDFSKSALLAYNFKAMESSTRLFLIADVLKNMDFVNCHNKKFAIVLFIFLGKNTNSSCVAIKIHNKGGVAS